MFKTFKNKKLMNKLIYKEKIKALAYKKLNKKQEKTNKDLSFSFDNYKLTKIFENLGVVQSIRDGICEI